MNNAVYNRKAGAGPVERGAGRVRGLPQEHPGRREVTRFWNKVLCSHSKFVFLINMWYEGDMTNMTNKTNMIYKNIFSRLMSFLIREAAKKITVFFSGLATKAVPPPLELSGHKFFSRIFFRASKNGLFLVAKPLTPPGH